MSRPAFWPREFVYYPIGNTSPAYLLEDLPPEARADVLLLGCGDARHILFSLYTREKASIQTPIDITCCDIEPAVLARNIILFTLLFDYDVAKIQEKIRSLIFDLFIDQATNEFLIELCDKLIDYSSSLDKWRKSTYSSFLSFCSQNTLDQIRTIWQAWSKSSSLNSKQRNEMTEDFRRGIKKQLAKIQGARIAGTLRAAGLLVQEGKSMLTNSSQEYWEKGSINPQPRSQDPRLVNPTFYYTSQPRFGVDYLTSPLSTFHLARGLAPLTTPSDSLLNRGQSKSSIQALKMDAYDQFGDWCAAARRMLLHKDVQLRIRFFVGDTIPFCLALQAYSRGSRGSGQFVKPWTTTPLILDGDDYLESATHQAPATFNVIDTSNLADHIGLITLLTMAIPILSRTPSSVLYTETMRSGIGGEVFKDLRENLCADFTIFQILFGISPSAWGFHLASQSSTHEMVLRSISLHYHKGYSSGHERIPWKDVAGCTGFLNHGERDNTSPAKPTYTIEPGELAAMLGCIYHYMFIKEDWENQVGHMKTPLLSLGFYGLLYYTRATFIALLLLARQRLPSVDWVVVMDVFLTHLLTNEVPTLGMAHFHDVCCLLHLYGLINLERTTSRMGIVIRRDKPITNRRFARWSEIPTVARVVLVVPRVQLAKVEDVFCNTNAAFQCDVRGSNGFIFKFSSLEMCFGHVVSSPGPDGAGEIVIEEDPLGVRGTSADMIVSFWAPMHLLLDHTLNRGMTEFGLSFHSAPDVKEKCEARLGPGLRLFTVSVDDAEHLFFSRELPTWAPETLVRRARNVGSSASTAGDAYNSSTLPEEGYVKIAIYPKIATFTMHLNLLDSDQKASLLGGVAVSYDQVAPCKIVVRFAEHKLDYVFPFPVDGEAARIRIARKSSYIEVIAPTWDPTTKDWKGAINRFPIVRLRDNVLTSWNMHHVVLDSLPILDLLAPTGKDRLAWYRNHHSCAYSDKEIKIREKPEYDAEPDRFDVLVRTKDVLMTIFFSLAGLLSSDGSNDVPPSPRLPVKTVFCLETPEGDDIHTVIFVADVRLDLASHTVIADSFILPMTRELVVGSTPPAVGQTLYRLLFDKGNASGLSRIRISSGEVTAWKQLLPAYVERCRQWSHSADSCEYLLTDHIPLSAENMEAPICTCGQGQDADLFRAKFQEWDALAPYVTRAAISPIFAVSYLESVGSAAKDMFGPAPKVDPASLGVDIDRLAAAMYQARSPAAIVNGEDGKCCANCGGRGFGDGLGDNVKLLACARCRKVKYCSTICQKADWKRHKPRCTSVGSTGGNA